MMGSRTSVMNCISLRTWGFEKVNVFYNTVRPAPDQDMAFTGDLIRDKKGRVWEFVSRKDEQIQVRTVTLKSM